jgi:hypothetical protein
LRDLGKARQEMGALTTPINQGESKPKSIIATYEQLIQEWTLEAKAQYNKDLSLEDYLINCTVFVFIQ